MRVELACIKTVSVAVGLMLATALMAAAQNPAQLQGKTAEQAFKNIQVLKGIPAEQVVPTMRFMRDSLGGVACTFCHADDRSSDDKPEKVMARKMIAMELAINKDTFGGTVEVTCYTCHRGAAMPVGTPVLSDETIAAAAAPPANKQAPAGPSVDQILAKYIDALGGEQALRKVTSRVMTGTVDLPAAAGNPGAHLEMEVDAKAPNLTLMTMPAANGAASNGFDGAAAWAQDNRGRVTLSTGTALARAVRDSDFYQPLDLKQQYDHLVVAGTEKVGARDTFRVIAFLKDDVPEQLYFDTQTGLLVRRIAFNKTLLGNDPTYTDYNDYRDAGDGVKVPFLVESYVLTQKTTTHVLKVQDNVAIDSGKFSKPAPKAAPAAGQ
jgi:photosynthetic reaction center cytochrome c subunit